MKRIALFVCAVLLALPLAAHERKVILVLVDTENNRAFIPEGTVVPPHLKFNVRMEKRQLDDAEVAQLRGGRDGAKGDARMPRGLDKASRARMKAKPPLVLQYAPAERFESARRNYEAQQAKRRTPVQTDSSHMTCYDIYVQDSEQGHYNTYYNGFTSTACMQSSGIQVGYPANWEYGAAGDYSDYDNSVSPHVYVDDNLGNYQCWEGFAWPGTGSCSDGAYTTLLQQGCLNTVDTGGVQYVIEYGYGYDIYYTGFLFLVDYCTYHY